MSKVKVTGDATGMVVIPSKNNPLWGYIRLQQAKPISDEAGFLKNKTISTLLKGTVEDLKAQNWIPGQEVNGVIYIKESFQPFNKKNPENDLKIAGDTKIVCTQKGQPIYRQAIFSFDPNRTDVLIQHDNIDAIRAEYLKLLEAEKTVTSAGSVAEL